jgi:hypothetical protein
MIVSKESGRGVFKMLEPASALSDRGKRPKKKTSVSMTCLRASIRTRDLRVVKKREMALPDDSVPVACAAVITFPAVWS